ncbi:nucleoside deaminase [Flavobacterium cyanobacteriorum]|nr:nucleoside deaminase [Flavobacterium cyanobacteriorum]
MQQCIMIAEKALQKGNPPVGAILICNDEMIGSGEESGKTSGDVTLHAEILAVKDAIARNHTSKLRHAMMFTTHEPCLMCSYVLRHHHIPIIIYGSSVPHVGGATSHFGLLRSHSVPGWGKPPKLLSGICADECNRLSTRYAERHGRAKD